MKIGTLAQRGVELAPMLLLGAICLVALGVSIAPPSVEPPANTKAAFPANRAVMLPVILSAYTTVNRGPSRLMGVSNIAREWGSYGLLGHVFPATAKLPVIGRYIIPEPERLLALHPDALFIQKQQSEVLRKLGMPGLVEVSFMPRDARKSRIGVWQLLGRSTGNMPRVMELMRWDAKQRADLQMLLGSLPGKRPPRVLLAHAGKGTWSVAGGYYAMGSSIEEAGGINLAGKFRMSGQITVEQILALDPDIILLDPNVMMSPNSSSYDVTPRDIYNMPACAALRAVKSHRVYMLPQHSYTNESIDDPLIDSWMAEIFYPDQMPRRARTGYRAAYRDIYGYELSEDEIDQQLFVKENLTSAGYERFSREMER